MHASMATHQAVCSVADVRPSDGRGEMRGRGCRHSLSVWKPLAPTHASHGFSEQCLIYCECETVPLRHAQRLARGCYPE